MGMCDQHLLYGDDIPNDDQKDLWLEANRYKNMVTDLENENQRLRTENKDLKTRLEKADELPCKVGNTVYYAHLTCDYKGKEHYCIDKGIVNWFHIDIESTFFYVRYESGLTFQHPIRDFGIDVFLTETEAEKVLELESK